MGIRLQLGFDRIPKGAELMHKYSLSMMKRSQRMFILARTNMDCSLNS